MPRQMDWRHKPIYWLLEAEKTESLAESMASIPECRERLLRVAQEYRAMAHSLEELLRGLLDPNSAVSVERRNVTPFRPAG